VHTPSPFASRHSATANMSRDTRTLRRTSRLRGKGFARDAGIPFFRSRHPAKRVIPLPRLAPLLARHRAVDGSHRGPGVAAS
jgi:hypothetical protein